MNEYKIVKTEVVNLFRDKSFESEVVSQALIWEKLKIIRLPLVKDISILPNRIGIRGSIWNCSNGLVKYIKNIK